MPNVNIIRMVPRPIFVQFIDHIKQIYSLSVILGPFTNHLNDFLNFFTPSPHLLAILHYKGYRIIQISWKSLPPLLVYIVFVASPLVIRSIVVFYSSSILVAQASNMGVYE